MCSRSRPGPVDAMDRSRVVERDINAVAEARRQAILAA